MKIDTIEKYKGDTYCLIFEDESRLYLNLEVIHQFKLETGVDYDEEIIQQAEYEHLKRKARRYALYSLGTREYCYQELCQKLTRTYNEEIAMETCDLMLEYGYINDEDYGERLAENLIFHKKNGLRKVRYEMLKKGLDKYLVEEILLEYTDEDFRHEIMCVLERKFVGKLETYPEVKKAMDYFARRGYSYSDVKMCIEELKSEIELDDVEEDWE